MVLSALALTGASNSLYFVYVGEGGKLNFFNMIYAHMIWWWGSVIVRYRAVRVLRKSNAGSR